MTTVVRVDRPRCIGAGNCITLAPTAFDWLTGDFGKAMVVEPDTVDDELLRAAVVSCPTQAILMEEVGELLPLKEPRTEHGSRRGEKAFLFTDIVGSTTPADVLGAGAWEAPPSWHGEALRGLF